MHSQITGSELLDLSTCFQLIREKTITTCFIFQRASTTSLLIWWSETWAACSIYSTILSYQDSRSPASVKMASFPEDLLVEILSLLPVVTLIQFRCVCKSWYALLQSPAFISKHVSSSHNKVSDDHHRLIVGHKALPNECGDFKILSYDTSKVIQEDFRFRLSEITSGWYCPRLLGCYNGLICLSDDDLVEIAFWNPATRQLKAVTTKRPRLWRLRRKMEHAFGYDFKRNDYKVMKITAVTKCPPYKYHIKVYSFNTGSWRKTRAVIPDGFCFHRSYERPTTCVKGISSTVAYTRAKNREVPKHYLFTFDMSNEAFIVTPMPEGVIFEEPDRRHNALTELRGSVSFIKHRSGPGENEGSFTVFILNEYGSSGIWTKLYTIAPLYNGALSRRLYSSSPIGFWKNDELFIDIRDEDLLLCDAKTNELRTLDIDGMGRQVLEYKESLVWINDGNHAFGRKKSGENYQIPERWYWW